MTSALQRPYHITIHPSISQSTTSQRPPLIMPPPLHGQLVHVAPQNFVGRPNSEGGNGFVKKDHADGSFDVRYCIDGSVEKNVNRLRITSLNPLVTTARRTNGTDVARPSAIIKRTFQKRLHRRGFYCGPALAVKI